MSMRHKVQLKLSYIDRYSYPNNNIEKVPIHPGDEVIQKYKDWCREKIGTNKWNYYGKYRKVPYEFRFKEPIDALAFKLTFGL